MTARSIRRAQERIARKAAEKSVSANRLIANQANAQLSTGPRVEAHRPPDAAPNERGTSRVWPGPASPLCAGSLEEGKRKSSLNAVKTALTGHTVLLPSDDAEAYLAHHARFVAELQPEGLRESELVHDLANAQWRLQRIASLEMAIYARGREEFTDKFEEAEVSARPALIDLETFLAYEKQLRNLQLQENRLRRQREKDLAELKLLQTARKEAETAEPVVAAKPNNLPFDPADFGFEFSTSDIESHLAGVTTSQATLPAAA